MPHMQASDPVPSTSIAQKAGLLSTVADASGAHRVDAIRWIRGEPIGKGTYGRVYLALSISTGKPQLVAVKQVDSPQVLRDESDQRQARFVHSVERVSKLLVDLNHPHIVQYLGFQECLGDYSRVLNIFMEYVSGSALGCCLREKGKFSEDVAKFFTLQILGGLRYLHSRRIIYRNLKADSVLLDRDGNCKLSDLEFSTREDKINKLPFTTVQRTLPWMAPEVICHQKEGYCVKADIWSLGCILLEMLTGKRPWYEDELIMITIKMNQNKRPPIPPDVILSDLAMNFQNLCFAINPDERESASHLERHAYLKLSNGWRFQGFNG
ncbi:kinase-like protein [Rhizopogon vinicolor AM-OR11-026]|uniref:Kinase-like protein n=1 Tax=Rhizopogon vinicolor AM-OR11-026 TaxID=1314800 RepID=A0A1B7NDH1_9AGAM|nr:kinase-like protein [Rhizopogon vinicolor AM-OR11-026]